MNGRGKGRRADKGHLDQAETNLGPAAPPCGTLLACFSLHYTQLKRTEEFSVLPLEGVEWRKKEKEGGGRGGRREGRAGGEGKRGGGTGSGGMRRRRGGERRQRGRSKNLRNKDLEDRQLWVPMEVGRHLSLRAMPVQEPPRPGDDRFSLETWLGQRKGNGFRTRAVRFLETNKIKRMPSSI